MTGGIPRGRLFLRGGLTTFVGYIIILAGVIGGVIALEESYWFSAWLGNTQQSLPQYTVIEDWMFLLFSAVSVGVGIMLAGFAADERRREEGGQLDPMDYPPFRRPSWQKAVPAAVVLSCLIALPGIYFLPTAGSFQGQVPVGSCAVGVATYSFNLPSGATLAYEWHSSNGAPITEVYAPDGPTVTSNSTSSDIFENSSFGYASFQSNGTPIQIWACDSGATPAGLQINLTGNYYVFR